MRFPLSAAILTLLLFSASAGAQMPLGNITAEESIVTARLDGYTISGLVSRLPGKTTFKYGIALFPGYPSIMRLHEEEGRLLFEMKGNTLIRGRHFFLDKDTLVLSVDAPSDEWGNFSHHFRRGARYGKDVRALLQEVMKQYPVADWTFVGHSEGAVSAYGAGAPNLDVVNRIVLVSSVFVPTKNGPGISGLDWDMLNKRLLFVHHENDPCQYTPYRSAKQYAEKTGSPLLTVRGGTEPSGDPCRALSEHGLPGMEQQTFEAIRTWSRAGDVPATVGP